MIASRLVHNRILNALGALIRLLLIMLLVKGGAHSVGGMRREVSSIAAAQVELLVRSNRQGSVPLSPDFFVG